MVVFNRSLMWAALLAALAFLVAQWAFRPMWRDEYWALYFSDPGTPLGTLVFDKITRDVHPPLYFSMLHGWRQIMDNEVWSRAVNLVVIAVSAALGWAMRSDRRDETALYLFLVGVSFWMVFYAAEARMMSWLFCGAALMVLAARNALTSPDRIWPHALIFAALGAFTASLHFFGALWVGALGGATGVSLLLARRPVGFLTFGAASVAAVLPALAWIAIVRPDHNPGAPDAMRPFGENVAFALNQLLRGLVVKTFLANIAAFVAAGFGVKALAAGPDARLAATIAAAVLTAILVAFGIHLFWVACIKERAFIVIIPGIFLLVAMGVRALAALQSKALKLAAAIPVFAILSFPVFSSELFKDREQMREVRRLLAASPACAGAPVVAWMRPSDQAEDFSAYFTRMTLKGAIPSGDLKLIDAATLAASGEAPPTSACPIKALAAGLLKGDEPMAAQVRADLSAVGVDLAGLEERRLGRGSTLVWVEAGTQAP